MLKYIRILYLRQKIVCNFIKKVDKKILNSVSCIQRPAFNRFLVPITKVGSMGLIWVLLSIPMLFSQSLRNTGIKVILVVLLTGFLGEGLIKHLAKRKRPSRYIDESDMLIRKPVTYSFPSGHTSASVASAIVIARSCPKLLLPVAVLAFLVSFSRLYFKVHYLSDIVAGALLGLVLACLVSYF